MTLFFVLSVLIAQAQGEDIGYDQYLRIMDGGLSPLKQVSFLYEGEYHWIGESNEANGIKHGDGGTFQGLLKYRDDESVALLVYSQKLNGTAAPSRNEFLLKGGQLTTIQHVPDFQPSAVTTEPVRAILSSLNQPDSPLRFFCVWIPERLRLLTPEIFEFLGWEKLGDRNCLKIGLNLGSQARSLYWIDVERGAHPLRIEEWRSGNLRSRLSDVNLSLFKAADRADVWLPVAAIYETFMSGEKLLKEPQVREVYRVLQDSVRINEPIDDAAFEPAKLNDKTRPKLNVPLARQFEEAVNRPQPPPAKVDNETIQEELDRRLEEAQAQARMLEAEPLAQYNARQTLYLQVAVAIVAASLLAAAFFLMKRGQKGR